MPKQIETTKPNLDENGHSLVPGDQYITGGVRKQVTVGEGTWHSSGKQLGEIVKPTEGES